MEIRQFSANLRLKEMNMPQSTLAGTVFLGGISLHSGEDVRMELRPAPEDSGLVFHVHDGERIHVIPLHPEAVSTTELATTVSDGAVKVSTVEHMLAALSGLRVDNAEIHVFSSEVPILDGSSLMVVQAVRKAGILVQKAARRVLRIARAISMEKDGKAIEAVPCDGLRVDYEIDFPHPSIGRQRLALEVTPESFEREIAGARTFGFFNDVEYLHKSGLALGGSLNNVVVLDDRGVMNEGGLRYPDEFVRHKILDFIGDMAMLGTPLCGSFTVRRSGHSHNNAFLRSLKFLDGALEPGEE